MINGDQFVGMVTLLLGLVIVISSGRNAPFLFQLAIPKMLEARFGRKAARILLTLVGVGFWVLGISIMQDWVIRPFSMLPVPEPLEALRRASFVSRVMCSYLLP
jgi:hypothetical protein